MLSLTRKIGEQVVIELPFVDKEGNRATRRCTVELNKVLGRHKVKLAFSASDQDVKIWRKEVHDDRSQR